MCYEKDTNNFLKFIEQDSIDQLKNDHLQYRCIYKNNKEESEK